MTIGEVINMLMEIFNYLSKIFGDLFNKEEAPEEGTTEENV